MKKSFLAPDFESNNSKSLEKIKNTSNYRLPLDDPTDVFIEDIYAENDPNEDDLIQSSQEIIEEFVEFNDRALSL